MSDPSASLTRPANASPAAHCRHLRSALSLRPLRMQPLPGPVCVQRPGLRIVRKEGTENRLDLGTNERGLDGHDHLDAVIQVALHQIGAAEEKGLGLAGLEAEETAVLEEAPENRSHP